ncbi:unnamed protein product [Ectocarpus fasciculatus]
MASFSDALADAENESAAAAVVAAAVAAVDTAVATGATDTEAAEGSGVESGRDTVVVSPAVDAAADAAGVEVPRAASVLPSIDSDKRSGEGVGVAVPAAVPTPTYPAFTDPLSATITPTKVVQKKAKLVGGKGSAPVLGAADVASMKKGAVAEKIALMEATFSSTAAAAAEAAAASPRPGLVNRKGNNLGWARLNATGSWSSNGSWRSAGGSTPADTDPSPKDGGDAGAATAVVGVFSFSKVDDSAATTMPPAETEGSSNAAGSVAGASCSSAPSSLEKRTDDMAVPTTPAAATGDGASAAAAAAAAPGEDVPGDGSTAITVAVESEPGGYAPRPHTAPCGDTGGLGSSGDAFETTASESGVAGVADAELGAAAEPDNREGVSAMPALAGSGAADGLARADAPEAQALGAKAGGDVDCQGGVSVPLEADEGEGGVPGRAEESESDGEEVEVGESERGSTAGVGDVGGDGLDVSDGLLPPPEIDNGSLEHGHGQSEVDEEGVREGERGSSGADAGVGDAGDGLDVSDGLLSPSEPNDNGSPEQGHEESEADGEDVSDSERGSSGADAGVGDVGDGLDVSNGMMPPSEPNDNTFEHGHEESEADGEDSESESESESSAADAGAGDVGDDPDASVGLVTPSAADDNTSQQGHEETEANGEAVEVGESENVAADTGHVGDDLDAPDVMLTPLAIDDDTFQHGHEESEAEGEAVEVGESEGVDTGMGHVGDDDLDVSETLAAMYETEDDIARSGGVRENAHGESETGGAEEGVREPSPMDGGHGVGGGLGGGRRRASGRGKRLAACCLSVTVPIAVIVMMLAAGAALIAGQSATPTIIPATLDSAFGAAMDAAARVMPTAGGGGEMTERLRGALRDAYLSVVDPGAPGPADSDLFSGSGTAARQAEIENTAPGRPSAEESLSPRRRGEVGPSVLSEERGRLRPAPSEPTTRAGQAARGEDGGVAAAGERPERRRLPVDKEGRRAGRRRQEMTAGGGGSGGEFHGRELWRSLDDGGAGAGAAVGSVSTPSPDGGGLEETATAAAATDGKAPPDDPTHAVVGRSALTDRQLDARAAPAAEGAGAATSAVARGPVPEAAVPPKDCGGGGGGATSTEEALSGAARGGGDELPGTAAKGPSTAAATAVLLSSPAVGVAGEAAPPKSTTAGSVADGTSGGIDTATPIVMVGGDQAVSTGGNAAPVQAAEPVTATPTSGVSDEPSTGGMSTGVDDDTSESAEAAERIAAAAAAAAAVDSLTAGDSATDNLEDDDRDDLDDHDTGNLDDHDTDSLDDHDTDSLDDYDTDNLDDHDTDNLDDHDDTGENSAEGEERMAVEEAAGVVLREETGLVEVGDEDDGTGEKGTEAAGRIAAAEAAGVLLQEETGSVEAGEGWTEAMTANVVEGGGIQDGVGNEDEEREDVAEMAAGAGEENDAEPPLPAFMRPDGGMVTVAFLSTGCRSAKIAPGQSEGCESTPMLLGHTGKNLMELVRLGKKGKVAWRSRKSLIKIAKQSVGSKVSSLFRRRSESPEGGVASGPVPPHAIAGLYLRETSDGRLALMKKAPADGSSSGGGRDGDMDGEGLGGAAAAAAAAGHDVVEFGVLLGDVAGAEAVAGGGGGGVGDGGVDGEEKYAAMLTPGGGLCVFGTRGGVRCMSRGVHRWAAHVTGGEKPYKRGK